MLARGRGACARVRPMAGPAEPSRPLRALARNVVPWLVAAGLLGWVLHNVKWADILEAFKQAPLVPFVAVSLVLLVLNCAADTFAMYFTFGWFGVRIPYREIFVIRAATYLLAVVQYYVGQAAIVAFLYRRGVSVLRGSAFILFISGINLGVLVLLASAGLATGNAQMAWLRYIPAAVGVGAVVYAVLLQLRPPALVGVRLFAPLFEMGVAGHVKATVVRIPHVLVIIVWHFIALRMFSVPVTPFQALMYLPAVFFLAALPISVQGLGMSQGAAVFFFATPHDRASEAHVLAYTFAMTGVGIFVQLAMGFSFLPSARRLGLRTTVPVAEASQTAAGT
jgi:hypothetical protein